MYVILNGVDNAFYPACILRPGASTVLKIKSKHKETLTKLIVTADLEGIGIEKNTLKVTQATIN